MSRSVIPLIAISARRERWGSVFGAAIGAFVLASTVEAVATLVIGRFIDAHTFAHVSATLVAGLAAMALGGYVAAWLRPRASSVVAVIIVVVVVFFMATMEVMDPLWYHIGFLVFGPLAALAGGAFMRRRRCKK